MNMNDLSKLTTGLQEDQEAIRAKCFHPSGAFSEFKRKEIEQSIPDRFMRIVAKYPDQIAVKTEDRLLTYRELNQMANRIARAILKEHGKREEPTALLFEQGPEAISAARGTLKADKIYVLLDPALPRTRAKPYSNALFDN